VHPVTDQVLVFVDGHGAAMLGGQRRAVGPNDLVFVRAGVRHNFLNTGNDPLHLITIYAPPEHEAGTVHQTKADADAAQQRESAHHDGGEAGRVMIDPTIVTAARGAGLIGAPTTDSSDNWSWARQPAAALAKTVGARLILADVSTRSMWTTPYGSGGVGAERDAPYTEGTTIVSRAELKLLGRNYLIEQLDAAESEGVDVAVWLADEPGVRALDRFLELFPVDVLVVPPLDSPSLVERVLGDDMPSIRRRMENRLLLVANEDGSLSIDGS
jgi:Cupin domain